ncbi:MAG TPA: GNAT family N-acetyltransferase [Candidatus Elarobacter sp.]|nr:GNAT family N-acetyltransferase [Candidatus Elarobacter sp.]
MTGYTFERVAVDDPSLERSAALLRAVFPSAHYTAELLRWQYRDNPAGAIIGWNAVAGDGSLAAHYVVQPLDARLDGVAERGALSFNTATHPAHQGKGLFTELGRRTYASAAEAGYGHVVGVANANSTPGFTRKLGFALVAQLHARIGLRTAPGEDAAAAYERTWTPASAAWRAANPHGRYRAVGDRLYAATPQPLIRALLARGRAFENTASDSLGFRPIDLWLGLEPGGTPPGVDIPARLRPSPLNFIFLDLRGANRAVPRDGVRFRAADFDPY